jgi:hypothetical protein
MFGSEGETEVAVADCGAGLAAALSLCGVSAACPKERLEATNTIQNMRIATSEKLVENWSVNRRLHVIRP